jgi:hypothetical protein
MKRGKVGLHQHLSDPIRKREKSFEKEKEKQNKIK